MKAKLLALFLFISTFSFAQTLGGGIKAQNLPVKYFLSDTDRFMIINKDSNVGPRLLPMMVLIDTLIAYVARSSSGSSNYWSILGNSGTSAHTNFLGTTDNMGMMVRTNNIERAHFDTLGNLYLSGTIKRGIWNGSPIAAQYLNDSVLIGGTNVTLSRGSAGITINSTSSGGGVDTATPNAAGALSNYQALLKYIPFADTSASSTWTKKVSSIFGLHDSLLNYPQRKDSNIIFATPYSLLKYLPIADSTLYKNGYSSLWGLRDSLLNYPQKKDSNKQKSFLTPFKLSFDTNNAQNYLCSISFMESYVAQHGGTSKSYVKDSAWLLTGNSGTSPGTNFIGTTDANALQFDVNGAFAGWIGKNYAMTPASKSGNVLLGYGSGASNTGYLNTAIGYEAASDNTSGVDNTSLGALSLWTLTTASSNTGLGAYSLYSNNSNGNVAVGDSALYANTSGTATAVGYQALAANTTGVHNTTVGRQSASTQTTASSVTAMGYEAAIGNTADAITAIGDSALAANTGTANTAVGYQALVLNTSGKSNIALGNKALAAVTVQSANVAIGNLAGNKNTADYNIFIGDSAGYATTTGNTNVFIGFEAAKANTSGNNNVIEGYMSGSGGNNFNDVAIGSNALQVGQFQQCVAIGTNSQKDGNGVKSNTSVGYGALFTNSTGSGNTAIGDSALFSNTNSYNTAIGYNASTGSGNTNAIAIGNGATASASNTTMIGNTSQTALQIGGGGSNNAAYCINVVDYTQTTGTVTATSQVADLTASPGPYTIQVNPPTPTAGQLFTVTSYVATYTFTFGGSCFNNSPATITPSTPATWFWDAGKSCWIYKQYFFPFCFIRRRKKKIFI